MSRKGFDINEWLTPENKTRIRGWCLDGLIDKQIYKNMGVSRTTFYKWKSENSEFADLLKRGKEIADRKNKLTAAGYNYNEVQAAVNSLNKKSVTTIAKEVIAGKWGNGSDRKKKLESAGYNYNEVQKEVNRLL